MYWEPQKASERETQVSVAADATEMARAETKPLKHDDWSRAGVGKIMPEIAMRRCQNTSQVQFATTATDPQEFLTSVIQL